MQPWTEALLKRLFSGSVHAGLPLTPSPESDTFIIVRDFTLGDVALLYVAYVMLILGTP